MNQGEPHVCWFRECNKDSVPLVGGKNASLGELINAGIRVPPGYAITTAAYRQFLIKGGVADKIAATLKGLDDQDMAAL